jgi:hypothetical protein
MKMMKLFIIVSFISVVAKASGSLWTDVRDTATAPARAAVEAVKDPTPEKIIIAANPTLSQAKEADKHLGVTDTLKTAAGLPKKADGALNSVKQSADNANSGVTEVRGMLPGIRAAISDTRTDAERITSDVSGSRSDLSLFLATISLPAQVLLWALAVLASVHILRILRSPLRK